MDGPLRLILYPVLFTILSLFSILYYTIYYSMSKLYRVPRFSLSLLLPSRHASSLTTPPSQGSLIIGRIKREEGKRSSACGPLCASQGECGGI